MSITGTTRVLRPGLAAAGAMALVILSAGSAGAAPPLDAADDVGTPLNDVGTVQFSLLANDTGENGAPADCSTAPTNNCLFDDASVDPAGLQGANGILVINPESGDAEYATTIDPAQDPAGYAQLIASAPACTGALDTFSYTLIGAIGGVPVDPANSDTATVTIAIGTAQRQVDAVDDAANTVGTNPITGDLLTNDCDQTGAMPADPANITAALEAAPANGTAVVNPDGTATYTANAGFSGTDTFTYTITTTDDGDPRTDTATVTITVGPAQVVPPPPGPPDAPPPGQDPDPGLPATGVDNAVPLALGGGGLLLLGSALLVLARRRSTTMVG